MKSTIIALAAALAAPQITQAQGTVTYLSNLGQPSTGSLAVGDDSWYATLFRTGNNVGGYVLNSIQLGMVDASGNPNGFAVMLYANSNPSTISPGSSLGTLDGSLNPVTAGTYTYTAPSNLKLSPTTLYYIVLTAGTVVANGAYDWSLSGANSYNPSGGWGGLTGVWTSSNGSSSWIGRGGTFPQYAINATAVPEPGVVGLFVLGALGFLWHGRKAKTV